MLPRSVSRWLAPLALLASLVAVLIVVSGATKDEEGGGGTNATTEERSEARDGETGTSGRTSTDTGTGTSTTPPRKTYTVRPGDTLGVISERTGVPVEELSELNPEVDPNSLTVGQKIKLTE